MVYSKFLFDQTKYANLYLDLSWAAFIRYRDLNYGDRRPNSYRIWKRNGGKDYPDYRERMDRKYAEILRRKKENPKRTNTNKK